MLQQAYDVIDADPRRVADLEPSLELSLGGNGNETQRRGHAR